MIFRLLFSFIVPAFAAFIQLKIFRLFVGDAELPVGVQRRAFLWGALGALACSAALQLSIGALEWPSYPSRETRMFYEGAIIGPLSEELFKALPALFWWLRGAVRGRRALLVVAAAAGSGFYFSETVISLLGAPDGNAWLDEAWGRGVLRGFSHALFTGFFGIGIGFAARAASVFWKACWLVAGFCAASIAHATNNSIGLAGEYGGVRGVSGQATAFIFAIMVLYVGLLMFARLRMGRRRRVAAD